MRKRRIENHIVYGLGHTTLYMRITPTMMAAIYNQK